MHKAMSCLGAFFLAFTILSGCGGGNGGEPGGSPSDGGNGGTPFKGDCPDGLDHVEAMEPVVTVGEGTAQTCTPQALSLAIEEVNAHGSGTILFDCGGEHTFTLSSSLQIKSSKFAPIIIDGEGLITISGGGAVRIFDLDNHTHFVVQRLTLRDGFVPANEPLVTNRPPNSGAAIRHPWFGTLKAIKVRFINNHCASREGEIGGGAVYAGGLTAAIISGCEFINNTASNGGGILNRGTNLTVLQSVFRENGALSVGSGQYGNGGGIYIDGMNYEEPGGNLILCESAFIDNTAMTHGSGVFSYFYPGSASTIDTCLFDGNRFGNPEEGSGALYHEAAPLLLKNTTLANHRTGKHAGGLFLGSGSSAEIVNCTFAQNEVSMNGAAIFNGASNATITNCTFTGNKADYGPAIFKGQSAAITLRNSLFANNTTDNQYSATSCHAPMSDAGGNMQWPRQKASGRDDVPCTDDILFADPILEPLADNGGFSPTSALSEGSPAIGIAHDCPPTDQRGLQRGQPCDVGAFELQ